MIRDSKNRLQPQDFKELFELIAKDKGSRLILLELGAVSLAFSDTQERVTIELVDYNICIDNNAVRHTLKRHSNKKKEEARGQVAVNKLDFERVEEVVVEYDNISFQGKDFSSTKQNNLLKFEKSVDGLRYICIVEIRVASERVALKTMYKKKNR